MRKEKNGISTILGEGAPPLFRKYFFGQNRYLYIAKCAWEPSLENLGTS